MQTRPDGHPQPSTVVRTETRSLGIATVYRSLKALLAERFLVAVNLPGSGGVMYERSGQRHHHYFRCRECERFFDIQACPGDLAKMLPKGYRLENHETAGTQ